MTVSSQRLSKGGLTLSLNIQGEQRADEALRNLGRRAEQPLARAINRAIQGVRTDLVDGAREHYNVKAKTVRGAIDLTRARASTAKQSRRLDARIRVSGSTLPLYSFGPRPRRPTPQRPPRVGVSVQVMKGSGRSKIPGAFVADLPARGLGIYRRAGRIGNTDKLISLHTVSVPQMVDHDRVLERVESGAQERFSKNLEHEVDRALSQLGLS